MKAAGDGMLHMSSLHRQGGSLIIQLWFYVSVKLRRPEVNDIDERIQRFNKPAQQVYCWD